MQGRNLEVNFAIILLHLVRKLFVHLQGIWKRVEQNRNFIVLGKVRHWEEEAALFCTKCSDVMKNDDAMWQSRLEHRATSAFTRTSL